MTFTTYQQFSGLQHVSLENSYVLDIRTEGEVCVLIDAVLTPEHPEYQPPPPGEVACFRKLEMLFPGARKVTWLERNMKPVTDASGETDYGSVDELYRSNGEFHFVGEFGHVRFEAADPVVRLRE